mmetsp:Transcript_88007/g.249330  ORF Transcript_88007/g.249330 Transcript_88007/m.249330 type:complete len:293 (+) Transcript_88007:384-1262(+)
MSGKLSSRSLLASLSPRMSFWNSSRSMFWSPVRSASLNTTIIPSMSSATCSALSFVCCSSASCRTWFILSAIRPVSSDSNVNTASTMYETHTNCMKGNSLFTIRAGVDQSSQVRNMNRVSMEARIVPNFSLTTAPSSALLNCSHLFPARLVMDIAYTNITSRKSSAIHPTLWREAIKPSAKIRSFLNLLKILKARRTRRSLNVRSTVTIWPDESIKKVDASPNPTKVKSNTFHAQSWLQKNIKRYAAKRTQISMVKNIRKARSTLPQQEASGKSASIPIASVFNRIIVMTTL